MHKQDNSRDTLRHVKLVLARSPHPACQTSLAAFQTDDRKNYKYEMLRIVVAERQLIFEDST